MPPLARADAASEAWALAALGPLLCSAVRCVHPLPDGGATHALLLPAANRERALRVTPAASALVQAAALRVAFLQLDPEDAAAAAAGRTLLVDVTAPEEHVAHALVVIARGRGRGASNLLWVFSDADVTVLEHSSTGRLIVEEPMSVEEAATALLAGVERACPAREAARLRKAGGPRPDVASEWTALRPSRLPPATPAAFEAAVGGFARETRAAVAAAAARAVAQAAAPLAASDDDLFSYDDDGDAAPYDDEDADEGAWAADAADEDDGAPAETPRATPGSAAAKAALAASTSPRKRSPRGGAAPSAGGGSAFARRRRVRLTLGITPETAAPVLRRKRIFGDATPAERDTQVADDEDDKAFDTPRGKRVRKAAASPPGDAPDDSGDEDEDDLPPSQPLLHKISQVARWMVGMT